MGQRGPKPAPTALKLERGNPGKRALNHDEPELPQPTHDELQPPKGMSGRAKTEWKRLADTLVSKGVLTGGDMHAFEQYCTMVGEVDAYEKLIKKVGRADSHRLGYANHLLKLRTQLRQQAAHLGLTPSSRSQVKAVKSTANVTDTKRKRFFAKRDEKESQQA